MNCKEGKREREIFEKLKEMKREDVAFDFADD